MRRSTLLIGILLLASCGGDRGTGATADAVPEWTLELVHEIGSIDDVEQTLTQVTEVRLAEDGTLFVKQDQDENIRVYGADGALEGVVGSRGQGPAELRTLRAIGLHGDTLWAFDSGNGAVKRYLRDGTFLEDRRWTEARLPSSGAFSLSLRSPMEVYVERDGSALAMPTPMISVEIGASGPPDVGVPKIPVVRISDAGDLTDTVAVFTQGTDPEMPTNVWAVDSGMAMMALLPNGAGFVWVDRFPGGNPEPGTFRVSAVSAEGDTLFSRGFAYSPLPVPDSMIAQAEEEWRDVAERAPGFAGERVWAPQSMPAVSRVVGTRDGPLWIARERSRAPQLWWALDATTGEHIGSLTLPTSEWIVEQRGDQLITVRMDELDVPYVRRYRVSR